MAAFVIASCRACGARIEAAPPDVHRFIACHQHDGDITLVFPDDVPADVGDAVPEGVPPQMPATWWDLDPDVLIRKWVSGPGRDDEG